MQQRIRAAVLALCAACGSGAAARAQDPFEFGRRWWLSAASADAWMPASVSFAAGGECVVSSASGSTPRLMLHASGELAASVPTAPVRQDLALGGPLGAVQVRGAADAPALFSLAQYAVTGSVRRSEVARREAGPGNFAALWSHSLGLTGVGGGRFAVARDGSRVVAASYDASSGLVGLEWLDGVTGAVQASRLLTSSTLRELAGSSDATRAAFVGGSHVWLVDSAGATLFDQDLGQASNALALAGDGATAAFGFGARVRVVAENAGAFQLAYDVWGAFGELPIRVALSDDGDTLAIAWWHQFDAATLRFQVLRGGADVFQHVVGNAGGFQNYPTATQLTPNGSHALFAAWGHPSTAPEAWLVDVNAGQLARTLELPGSALAAALDGTGTRIAVGIKHAHANQFASTGELRLYDTGARDLQVIGAPSTAAGLHLAARHPAARRAFFVLGHRLAAPVPFPGAAGWVHVDRGNGGRVFARNVDATGRADLQVVLPLASLGVDFAAQAAFRLPGGGLALSAVVVEPVVY